jgi:DNA topoisomerase-1
VVAEAVRDAADRLGNTPAVARGSYVHPAVPTAFLEGRLRSVASGGGGAPPPARGGVMPVMTPGEEAELLALLRRELARDAGREDGRAAGRPRGKARRT